MTAGFKSDTVLRVVYVRYFATRSNLGKKRVNEQYSKQTIYSQMAGKHSHTAMADEGCLLGNGVETGSHVDDSTYNECSVLPANKVKAQQIRSFP